MKELSIEEKAKRYDEAIERAKEINIEHSKDGLKPSDDVLYIFPELAESEDEMIRKDIVFYITAFHKDDEERARWIAWLEKQGNLIVELQKTYVEIGRLVKENCYLKERQGEQKPVEWSGVDNAIVEGICLALEYSNESGETIEKYENWMHSIKDRILPLNEVLKQKPADKVEPKFKVGDWIIHNKNTELANSLMLVTDKVSDKYLCKYRNGQCSYNIESIDKDYHLWTIQDAKDGDALFTSSTANHETFIFKSIDENGNAKCHFAYDSEDGFREGKYHFIGSATKCKPATKEQRDTLFQKMKEAGYEWDDEKKELKKIEQKPIWSEEDSFQLDAAINIVVNSGHTCTSDWLKSFKNRVIPQSKQEWSEEDEKNINELIRLMEQLQSKYVSESHCYPSWGKLVDWLKSLRPQSHWKPSNEQMEALWNIYQGGKEQAELATLYNDLKKL